MEKKIVIEEKRIIEKEKPKQNRKITNIWSDYINENTLTQSTQLECLMKNEEFQKRKRRVDPNQWIRSEIEKKLQSYKHQDLEKGIFDTSLFVNYTYILQLLQESKLQCHYCSEKVFVLYEKVREAKQWTLDRIDNSKGHNHNNVLVACLECNLRRRRTNKNAFLFTKQLVIQKIE